MTVAAWYAGQPVAKQAKTSLVIQLACAHYRDMCSDARWPGFQTALAELDGAMFCPHGQQFEYWRPRLISAANVCIAMNFDRASVIAAWRRSET